jgi:hypothetical protein
MFSPKIGNDHLKLAKIAENCDHNMGPWFANPPKGKTRPELTVNVEPAVRALSMHA